MFGHDDNFHKITSDKDPSTKVPANYVIHTRDQMKKTSKDHHYSFGMRPVDPNFDLKEKKSYEDRCRDLMSDRSNFLKDAQTTK